MEWDREWGDERCPDRSCGTCLPACTRINLLTLNDWRSSEGPWGPDKILRRPFSKTAWIPVSQKRSSCGSEKGKSLHASEERKKIGCGWVAGQGNYFKPGGQSLCVNYMSLKTCKREILRWCIDMYRQECCSKTTLHFFHWNRLFCCQKSSVS